VPAFPGSQQAETLDLPDLDKSDDTREVDVGVFELSLGEEVGAGEEEPASDTFEIDIQLLTDSGGNEAAADLDVGVSDLLSALPETSGERDSDVPAATSDDLDQHLETPLEGDEPSSDAELGDDGLETLPELMSEDGDGDAGPDQEHAFLPSAPEGEIPRGASYDSEWLLIGTACSTLWAGSGSLLAAGDKLMRFGSERRSDALPPGARISSLALLQTGNVALATTRGLFELGASGSWSPAAAPESARGSAQEVVELAAPTGQPVLWARLANGALFRRRALAWERHEAGGEVRVLTSSDKSVTLLVIAKRPTLQLSSDAGTSFRELLLPEPAATVALGAAVTALARGALIALADPERGLCVSNDGGETFRMVRGAVNVTAAALGEHAGGPAVFAALHREGKDLTQLIAVDPATGRAEAIAELSGEPDEESEETGRTLALVWSDGCLWCAGGYGLVKLRR
jgi:hypothetical protein